jgi:hypothetical protein
MEQNPIGELMSSYYNSLLLWNPKVHHRIHKILPFYAMVGQLNLVYTLASYILRSILILSSHVRLDLPSSLFLSCFLTEFFYTFLISLMRATFLAHTPAHEVIQLQEQWSQYEWHRK